MKRLKEMKQMEVHRIPRHIWCCDFGGFLHLTEEKRKTPGVRTCPRGYGLAQGHPAGPPSGLWPGVPAHTQVFPQPLLIFLAVPGRWQRLWPSTERSLKPSVLVQLWLDGPHDDEPGPAPLVPGLIPSSSPLCL